MRSDLSGAPAERHQDAVLEVADAGVAAQLRVKGAVQQHYYAAEHSPGSLLVRVEPTWLRSLRDLVLHGPDTTARDTSRLS